METSPRYLEGAAEFGYVDGPSARRIYIIFRFGYKPGTGVPGSSAVLRQGAHQAHHKGLDNRAPKKICTVGRRGGHFALNATQDPLEPSPCLVPDAGIGVAQALGVPECRIGQTALATKEQ